MIISNKIMNHYLTVSQRMQNTSQISLLYFQREMVLCFSINQLHDTSNRSGNYLTLQECDFICLISKKCMESLFSALYRSYNVRIF